MIINVKKDRKKKWNKRENEARILNTSMILFLIVDVLPLEIQFLILNELNKSRKVFPYLQCARKTKN